MELIEFLKEKNSHGAIDSIYNKGQIVPVGIAKVFEMIIKSGPNDSVDVCNLLKADYDESVFRGIKNYLELNKNDIIKRYRVRANKTVVGELPDSVYKHINVAYGNSEIISSFAGMTIVYQINKNDSVEVIDETNDHKNLTQPVYFDKDELDIIVRNM